MLSLLTAAEAPHQPQDTRGKERVDDRRLISGTIHVLKSGGGWSDAPRDVYGPTKKLRFVRWVAKGVWTGLFEALARTGGPPAQPIGPKMIEGGNEYDIHLISIGDA